MSYLETLWWDVTTGGLGLKLGCAAAKKFNVLCFNDDWLY